MKRVISYLLVLTLFQIIQTNLLESLAPNCGIDNTLPYRIVGGSDVTAGEHPWAVYISFIKDEIEEQLCTGTLITNVHVLTATHCVCYKSGGGMKCRDKNTLRVRVGSLDRFKKGFVTNVSDYKYNKKFNMSNPFTGGDIAILKLKMSATETTQMSENKIRPICLLKEEVNIPEGTWLTAIGWGKLSGGDSAEAPDVLQKVELEVVSKEKCVQGWKKPMDDRTICTVANEGKDICRGDSGGPLMVKMNDKWYQFGSTMFNDGRCGQFLSKPTVFVNLYSFREWIVKVVNICLNK